MKRSLAVVLIVIAPAVAAACMWDSDTVRMERVRFPSALELITGKFLRHSPEFYEWRVADRTKRLETDPSNLALLDDLAVATDKTGRHDEAIATALRAEALQPGRYETAANLGTFLIHAGRLAEGVAQIDRALAVNPDAHFGREKYQKRLAEWVLEQRQGGAAKLPIAYVDFAPGTEDAATPEVSIKKSFADHLWPKKSAPPPDEAAAATKGILGMMRFGNHDSPVLLEALGSILVAGEMSDPRDDAKQLAARAFLKASYAVADGPVRQAYRAMAAKALTMQVVPGGLKPIGLARVEAEFRKELAEADDWYDGLRQREIDWIAAGRDPEAEFERLYAAEPEISGMDVPDPMSGETRMKLGLASLSFVMLGGLAAAIGSGLWLLRRALW